MYLCTFQKLRHGIWNMEYGIWDMDSDDFDK